MGSIFLPNIEHGIPSWTNKLSTKPPISHLPPQQPCIRPFTPKIMVGSDTSTTRASRSSDSASPARRVTASNMPRQPASSPFVSTSAAGSYRSGSTENTRGVSGSSRRTKPPFLFPARWVSTLMKMLRMRGWQASTTTLDRAQRCRNLRCDLRWQDLDDKSPALALPSREPDACRWLFGA